ncbi:hypothetical protein ARHIZOSPH14_18940 [Agromyces rhizosphaerae]|uniref:Ribonuclease VapC n=1 Tax=Agromyces rhizosphaerae TaxID=88374 RepID=A0A9W6CYP6_9MICO|nr:PIN domain-containing protein [Agromyces rhizosphaerae]GLI27652.1 hypothetical protein ARHIZOSPH14_18940 [Agromyces rhizosphaerae]
MALLVDTSVWSLALRRDRPERVPEVDALLAALRGAEIVSTTGVILQELLHGVLPAAARAQIIERFAYVPMLHPDRDDHVAAAELRNTCRRGGVQLGTIDALIAQLAIRHGHVVLTTDRDFVHASAHVDLRVWTA